MEWQQLIGFRNVARLGSFTRAAEATYRTQSALTQQIKALENELECRLFERIGKRRLILTPIGEKLLVFADSLLANYDRFILDIREDRTLQRGRLAIAAPFTTLYHLMPGAIKSFIRHFPEVELSLLDRSQRDAIDLVKRGDVDFGVALESSVPPELSVVRWKTAESVLLVPTGHPLAKGKSGTRRVSAKEIARYPLILPPKTAAFSRRNALEELFRKYRLDYRIVMESSNVELSAVYVEMGLGISFASVVREFASLKNRKLEFVPLGHYFKPEHIGIIMRKDKQLARFHKAFLEKLTGKA
jgi:DNA-binding transcriptional LysR family regulator